MATTDLGPANSLALLLAPRLNLATVAVRFVVAGKYVPGVRVADCE